jgi:hypothetical protein
VNKSHFPKKAIFAIYLLIMVVLPLVTNLKLLAGNCLNATDFGIFEQAFFEISSGPSFNPYLTIRNLSFFNDHFLPITIPVAYLVRLFNYYPSSLIIIEWLFFISLFPFAFHYTRKNHSSSEQLVAFYMIIFSKGLLTGLEFPVHPAFWSGIGWFLLIKSIKKDETLMIVLSSIFLCLFRESFPFGIITLGIYYLLFKKFNRAGILISIGSIWIGFVQVIRPKIFGEVYNYGGEFLSSLVNSPFSFLLQSAQNFEYAVPFKILYPFIIPLYFVYKKNHSRYSPLWATAFLLVPHFLLHFLANKFHFQYGTTFVAPLLALIIFEGGIKDLIKKPIPLFLTLILFFASSSSVYTKMVKTTLFNSSKKCVLTEEKLNLTKKLVDLTREIKPSEKIISTAGVIPRIMRPGMQIYQFVKYSKPQPSYQYILLEKNNSGDIHPLSNENVIEIEKRCHKHALHVLMENEYFYYAKGEFPLECIRGK